MEKNMTGGLQAMHFVKAFIMSALITAMLLFLCAFLVLKSGMEEKNYPGGGGCDRSIYRGTLLGKKIGKTKIFVGIDLRNFVFSCLSVAFLFDQRSNAHHTGGDQILCGDGTGRNDWRNGELVHK